jgi:hypothetical protein
MRVSSSLLALALYLAGSFAAPAVDTNVGGVNRRLLGTIFDIPNRLPSETNEASKKIF